MFRRSIVCLSLILPSFLLFSCHESRSNQHAYSATAPKEKNAAHIQLPEFQKKLTEAAKNIINPTIIYDPRYFNIPYPNGDVPEHLGVCTDVVIRAYRLAGIDLQKEIHEDMKKHFDIYPKIWGLRKTDTNIDHRRVPNLMTFFSRHGHIKKASSDPQDYMPGDIVCWELDNGMTHIGIVIDELNNAETHYKIVHNIGNGQVAEDMLFKYKIIGHYTYEK